jgi:hypothetical protein
LNTIDKDSTALVGPLQPNFGVAVFKEDIRAADFQDTHDELNKKTRY